MANALYDAARESFLLADIDWAVDTIKLVITNESAIGGGVLVGTHDFLNDISAGTVATSGAFASKTSTAGVADAADITLTSVTGSACQSINIYKDTGTSSTSNLIAYINTATGLPVTPNGGNITITWDNGANKIFKL